ncbi:hypothetical protein ACW7G0_03340 [Lysobacter sp. A286]
MNTPLSLLLVLASAAAVVAFIIARIRRPGDGRQREMQQLLDAADRLEVRLRAARAEITAVVGEDATDPVQDALREMLRQRIWLREHGQRASVQELQEVRGSIEMAGTRIEQQLAQIQQARTSME